MCGVNKVKVCHSYSYQGHCIRASLQCHHQEFSSLLSSLPSLKCCFNSQRHLQDQSDSWGYSHYDTFNARNTENMERVKSLIQLYNPLLWSFSEANSISFTYTSLIRTESYDHT